MQASRHLWAVQKSLLKLLTRGTYSLAMPRRVSCPYLAYTWESTALNHVAYPQKARLLLGHLGSSDGQNWTDLGLSLLTSFHIGVLLLTTM
jgi:hypothetical protein